MRLSACLVALALAICGGAATGSHAASLPPGAWRSEVAVENGRGEQRMVGMELSLAGAGEGQPASGLLRFTSGIMCRVELEWRATVPEGDRFAVSGTSPGGFCKRYRFGEVLASLVDGQCAIELELSPDQELAATEATRSVKATLPCVE